VLTSGQAFHPGSVWTCWVMLVEASGQGGEQWSAIGPPSCAGPAWTCKTSFSPSSGTLPAYGMWVKVMTAIGDCDGYKLAFKTSTGTVRLPVQCGGTTTPGPGLIVDPPDIGLPGDADGWCALTSGVAFQKGSVWTCYVALFANSPSPIPWIAAGPSYCGSACQTTFSPSHGVAGAGGIWVKIMTAIGGCTNYTLSFKNPGKTVQVPVYCG
jgi:hypothetical protein